MASRAVVQWTRSDGVYRAAEPDDVELARCARALADAYNEPHNRAMMANDALFEPQDVIALWTDMRRSGGRPFLLYRDDEWMGDADFRHVADGRAEFAIMIGARARQGRGVGTTFGTMLHALAFSAWQLHHVYVTIIPANIASQRLFAKLGYHPDASPHARSYADADDDVSMSCDFAQFAAVHGGCLSEMQFSEIQAR